MSLLRVVEHGRAATRRACACSRPDIERTAPGTRSGPAWRATESDEIQHRYTTSLSGPRPGRKPVLLPAGAEHVESPARRARRCSRPSPDAALDIGGAGGGERAQPHAPRSRCCRHATSGRWSISTLSTRRAAQARAIFAGLALGKAAGSARSRARPASVMAGAGSRTAPGAAPRSEQAAGRAQGVGVEPCAGRLPARRARLTAPSSRFP